MAAFEAALDGYPQRGTPPEPPMEGRCAGSRRNPIRVGDRLMEAVKASGPSGHGFDDWTRRTSLQESGNGMRGRQPATLFARGRDAASRTPERKHPRLGAPRHDTRSTARRTRERRRALHGRCGWA